MQKYSLIALDMDGTLFNSRLEVSEENQKAIRLAAKQGKYVALSTGRCLTEIRDTLEILPEIRYMVCQNGSVVYDYEKQKTVFVEPIPTEEVRFVLENLKGHTVTIQCFHENQSHVVAENDDWMEPAHMEVYREVYHRCSVQDAHFFDHFDENPFRVEKFNLYFQCTEERDRMENLLKGHPVKTAHSFDFMLEVVSENADKGRGLRVLADYLGLPIEETIAVGDAMNDMEILQTAGLSAAMGNADEAVKAVADVVTADHDHDGVAKVIYEYLLDK